MLRIVLILCAGLLMIVPATAQENACPVVEQAAFGETQVWCADTAIGELCYGNPTLTVTGYDESESAFKFSGDKIDLEAVASFESSREEMTWGAALAQVEVSAAETWESANMTLLAFGNVTLTNRGQIGVSITVQDVAVSTSQGANVRSGPTTDNRVITTLSEGDMIRLTGRLDDNAWLRVQLRDGENGWMSALAVEADLEILPVVTVEDEAPDLLYQPYQAFDFVSGGRDARCDGAPDSGVMLQTLPDISYEVRVNGVSLSLAGTVYLQTPAANTLDINLIEGALTASTPDGEVTLEPGYRTTVSLVTDDEGTTPVRAPSAPVPYDYERLTVLPVEVMPRDVLVGLDLTTIITPRPTDGRSPLDGMLLDDPCKITVGEGGANLRSGPGTAYPIRGVIGFRESADPDGRAFGDDGFVWWRLAPGVWIRRDTTVWGGDCSALPEVPVP